MNGIPVHGAGVGAVPASQGSPYQPMHSHGTNVVNVSFYDGVPYVVGKVRCEALRSRSKERCGSLVDEGKKFCFYHEGQATSVEG